MESVISLIKAAKNLSELVLKERCRLPFNINLIDELHINENAHSRILNVLLQYSDRGRYPLCESFVEYMINNSIASCHKIVIKQPQFTCEENRVDLLIREAGKYGIVIENKIMGAGDQDRQLERYINLVQGVGLLPHQIYVVYLTKDGDKKVSELSLTCRAKDILEYGTDNSRYIAINYRDHILPWLEEVILPNCQIKESLLISAITQYIDHLKGYLNLKPQQILAQERMDEFVKNELNINSINEALEISSNVFQLSNSIESIIQGMVNDIAKDKIITPLDAYVRQFGCSVDYCNVNNYDTFGIRINNKDWNKCVIRFNLESVGFIYGICHLDADNNRINDEQNRYIKEIMSKLNFKQSHWWPCWKRADRIYAPNRNDYWIKVQYGELDVFNYLKKCFNEVYNALASQTL